MPRDKTGHFYYSWYPTIYQADTQQLTLAEDAAYRRLIDHYMTIRAPLLNDDRALARIIGIGLDEWEPIKNQIITYFKPSTNPAGYLLHKFCDEIIAKDTSRIVKSKTNGAKGGRPVTKGKTKGITHPVTEVKPLTTLHNTEQSKKVSGRGERFALQDPPADWLQFCVTQRPDLDPGKTFDSFRDYWIAKTGNNATKLDWFATWRNWVRNQKSTTGENYGKPTKLSHIARGIAEARAERQRREQG